MSTRMKIVALLAALAFAPPAAAAPPDWDNVGKALGKTGAVMGDVYRVAFPRSDLNVTLDGVAIKPGFALGGWLAFEVMGDHTMVMGDLVLTEDEVSPVMQKMIDSGIEITALHNHLLRSKPATFYMHVQARGDPIKLAQALHDGIALSATPFTASGAAESTPAIDAVVADLDKIMEGKGKANGGIVQYSFPRAEQVTDSGMPVPPTMGSAIAINFQLGGDKNAAITGDFVLLADEVQPVLRELRASGIEVTALHSHMLHENPTLYFMHFWANDNAEKLAKGLRAVLDKVNVAHT